jgi:hypothetical protein
MQNERAATLVEVDFDLDAATMTFVFTGTMGITPTDATETTLLAAAGADTDAMLYTPTGEIDEPRVDSTTFTAHLTTVDTGAIKIRTALATEDDTTFFCVRGRIFCGPNRECGFADC